MLILPPGHGEMLRTRPKLAKRERWIVAAVGALAAVIAAITIASIGVSSTPTARGCINATVPGATGAIVFQECGADARSLCATLAPNSGLSPFGLGVLTRACRKAGLKVPADLQS